MILGPLGYITTVGYRFLYFHLFVVFAPSQVFAVYTGTSSWVLGLC